MGVRVRPRHVAVASVAAALAAVLAVAGAFVVSAHESPVLVLRVDQVPEGVSARTIGEAPAVLVRRGDEVDVFVNAVRNQDSLTWCRGERTPGVFASVLYGSLFHLDGEWLGGPAGHDLDRLATRRDGDVLRIDSGEVVAGAGPSRLAPRTPHLTEGWERWITERPPGAYCPLEPEADRLAQSPPRPT